MKINIDAVYMLKFKPRIGFNKAKELYKDMISDIENNELDWCNVTELNKCNIIKKYHRSFIGLYVTKYHKHMCNIVKKISQIFYICCILIYCINKV